jgi:DNA-binding GntR family transcriptional regulator
MAANRLTERLSHEIRNMILAGEFAPDAHLSTQKLADRFGVSRSPVREALQNLAEQGALLKHPNRGFFVRETVRPSPEELEAARPVDAPESYYRLAEDWLKDAIPDEVTEHFLRTRYALTKSELMDILNRATNEGWAERKQGYGWRFLPVAKTPEALEQIYRCRSIIEPPGLLEPTFQIDWAALKEQKRIQEVLLNGDIERLPAERLMTLNSQFHEEILRMSGNPFLHQALIRLNRTRKLLEYRSMVRRERLHLQCREHLEIIDLIERGDNLDASHFMRRHIVGAITEKEPLQRGPHLVGTKS